MIKNKKITMNSNLSKGSCLPKMGLGCMPLSGCYGKVNQSQLNELLELAVSSNAYLLDTAHNYGQGLNESLIAPIATKQRSSIILSTKVGVVNSSSGFSLCGNCSYIKKACEESLKRLGTDYLDILYYHHKDPSTPIEETILGMADLVKEGKVRHLGLFEMEAETLKQAYTIHPILFYQAEYSLISRDVEATILPLCQKLGIHFIANAPLARGLLVSDFNKFYNHAPNDLRQAIPRFQKPYLEYNLECIKQLDDLAKTKSMTLSQMALVWLMSKNVIPIFGTTNPSHLLENLKATQISLDTLDLTLIDTIVKNHPIQGSKVPNSLSHLYLRSQ